jgi:DNA-binding transcriptional LysR family regulator
MAIELGALRTVIAAAEHRSFRRAAAALNLKQSTLSRRVRQLEAQFGVELFERSSGGVRVTAAGDKVVSAARHVLEQLNRMVSTARSAGRGEAGNIKIGVCTSLSGSKLHGVLAEYLQAYPDIEIQVVEQCRSRLLDGFEPETRTSSSSWVTPKGLADRQCHYGRSGLSSLYRRSIG